MSRTLRIAERAQADADQIFDWLVVRSLQGAISWYMAFKETVSRVADSPESFGLAPEGERLRRNIRQAPFKTRRGRMYRILFEVSDAEVAILRVRGPGQALLRARDLPSE
jgi:plasmid stabilization system protein ParE